MQFTITPLEGDQCKVVCDVCGKGVSIECWMAFNHTCTDGTKTEYKPPGFNIDDYNRRIAERRAQKKADREAAKRAEVEKNAPNIIRQGINYSVASVKHVAAGSPKASDEDVNKRFAICQSNQCGYYKVLKDSNGQCLHPSCGCPLKPVGINGNNKLRWADQKCPVGMWLPVEAVK